MPLQTSGPISLAQIMAEFSTSYHDLNSFHRGYGVVPDVAGNANVPTGGQISFSQLYGATHVVATAAVSISPNGGFFATGSVSSGGTLSQNFTASIANGVGPYSYAWTRTSGALLTATGTNTNVLRLSKSYTRNQQFDAIENWTVTVTDAGNGNAQYSASMSVEFDVESNR